MNAVRFSENVIRRNACGDTTLAIEGLHGGGDRPRGFLGLPS